MYNNVVEMDPKWPVLVDKNGEYKVDYKTMIFILECYSEVLFYDEDMNIDSVIRMKNGIEKIIHYFEVNSIPETYETIKFRKYLLNQLGNIKPSMYPKLDFILKNKIKMILGIF